MEITAMNLIPPNRLNKFLTKALTKLEASDPEMAKKLKAIRGRTRGKKIQFSAEAIPELTVRASQSVINDLTRVINLIYIKEGKSRITPELIKQAEEMQ